MILIEIYVIGITLIEVPYWWDKKADSLAATIYRARPDVLKAKPQGKPIPSSPSTDFTKDLSASNKITIYQ